MWEVWILLLQRFLQKPKSKRTFWKDSHKFRYFFLFIYYFSEMIFIRPFLTEIKEAKLVVTPSVVALEWILHRRTGCCWRPAGVEESDLLEHNHTANSEYNALYLTDKIREKNRYFLRKCKGILRRRLILPRVFMIRYSWSMSDFPGHRGVPERSSANRQPIAHTSTGGPYWVSPTSSSGARYQRVAT